MVIAIGLLIVGLLSGVYMLYGIKANGPKESTILSISDAFITITIGVFYLYCSLILAQNVKLPPNLHIDAAEETVLNTTNNNISEDMFDIYVTNIQSESATEVMNEERYTTEEIESITEELATVSEIKQNEKQSNNEFLKNYNNFLNNIIKQAHGETANGYINQTTKKNTHKTIQNVSAIFNNKNKTNRKGRTNDLNSSENQCLYKIFLQHSMLIYSFVYNIFFLINAGMECKACKIKEDEHQTDVLQGQTNQTNQEHADTGFSNGSSTFVTKEQLNVKLKREEGAKYIENASPRESQSSVKEFTSHNKSINSFVNYFKTILFIIFIWVTPILCVVVFYCLIFDLHAKTQTTSTVPNSVGNVTRFDEKLLNIIDNPLTLSETNNSAEVENIVRNIYKIINKQENNNSETPNINMFPFADILNNLDNNVTIEKCNYTTVPLKVYIFLLFVLGYILTIFYAKTVQVQVAVNKKSEALKRYIYLFAMLWLPTIVETFNRTYLTENMPNSLSRWFTLIGNTNILLMNVHNVFSMKTTIKNQSLIQPLH